MIMETITFHSIWPGGNTTAIVEGEFPVEKRRDIAAHIVKRWPEIEQVGFLHLPKDSAAATHLEMTGGEFCGNATRSAAFVWAQKSGKEEFLVEVSGMQDLIPARCTDSNSFVDVPVSIIVSVKHVSNGTLVDMQGISHLVIHADTPSTEEIHKILEPYKHLPAVGAIFTHVHNNTITIDPYVYFIQGTEPVLIRETGCASGSIAASMAQHQKDTSEHAFHVRQPSGETYEVRLSDGKNGIESISIGGKVEHRGTRTLEM